MRIAVIMPVAAGPAEAERFKDTAESLLALEPAVRWLVVYDDSPVDRHLTADIVAPETSVIVLRSPLDHRRIDRESRIGTAVLDGLRWVADNTDCDVVMKIDTDALVIAPFAEQLARALADESIGMLGSYDRDCNGAERSFAPLVGPTRRAAIALHPRQLGVLFRGRRARKYIRQSRAAGYQWGEHVLGCALAIARRTLDALRRDGTLDDPEVFVGTRLYDDPILGILVRGAGYRIAGHVEEHGGFGVSWRGLPDTPERLASRGFSIIHSVKNDTRFTESQIRSYFGGLRQQTRTMRGT